MNFTPHNKNRVFITSLHIIQIDWNYLTILITTTNIFQQDGCSWSINDAHDVHNELGRSRLDVKVINWSCSCSHSAACSMRIWSSLDHKQIHVQFLSNHANSTVVSCNNCYCKSTLFWFHASSTLLITKNIYFEWWL